ncbi:MAG: PBP1A family penicillin-binding protein [Coriobacteriia bacterium]|nr:PBP1A family penicillin-binding protein [Coriobacteriia bacterium]
MKRTKALVSVALSALCFGTLAVLTPMAYAAHVEPLPLLAWRFFIAALVIGFLAYRRNKHAFKVPKRDLARYFALSLFGYGASSLAFFIALKHAGSAVVSALLYAYPAIVALAAVVFFKEKLNRNKIIAIIAVAVGCSLVVGLFGGKASAEPLGIILALMAAFCYAAFNLMSQRWLPGRSSMTMMSFTFGFSAVLFVILSLISGGPALLFSAIGWSTRAWVLMILIIIFPTVVAILLYLRGVRQLGASEAAIVSTLEPLFTVLFAWLALGQVLGSVQLLGVLLIVGGIAASSIVGKTAEPPPTVPLTTDEIQQNQQPEKPPLSKGERRGKKIFIAVLSVIAVLILIQVIVISGVVWLLNQPAPDISSHNISERSSQDSIVYGADGSVLATWKGDEDRAIVAYAAIPQCVKNSTVAIEDKRFYEHGGVDVISIARALKRNTEAGVIKQGGSTITQQLIKMLYTGDKRTLSRKLREAIMATRVEMVYDKDRVLEGYLNMAYYGQGAYGIQSAATKYFSKDVQRLNIQEAAMLAGLVRSPSAYNAFKNPGPVKKRRDLVLRAMNEQGMITAAQYELAKNSPLGLVPPNSVSQQVKYPFFVDYVRRDLISKLGEEAVNHGGLAVRTTFDPALQNAAEATAKKFNKNTDPEVSIVTVRQSDGAVLAMVGGRDWGQNQYNLATQGRRQPGSAFKPFTLITALENGVSLSKTYSTASYSTPVKDGVWKVSNFSESMTSSSMTLRQATVWSVNTVYARLIMQVGAKKVAATAKKMGFSSEINPDPAIALGGLKYGVSPLEMASAYATIADNGQRTPTTGIVSVVDRDGKTLYKPSLKKTRIYSEKTGVQVASVLHEVVADGTGQASRISESSAGKTGTTQSYRDAWFVGWAHGVSTAVWMGHPEAQVEMTHVRGKAVTGGSFPAQMWARYMQSAIEIRPLQGCLMSAHQQTVTGGQGVDVVAEP